MVGEDKTRLLSPAAGQHEKRGVKSGQQSRQAGRQAGRQADRQAGRQVGQASLRGQLRPGGDPTWQAAAALQHGHRRKAPETAAGARGCPGSACWAGKQGIEVLRLMADTAAASCKPGGQRPTGDERQSGGGQRGGRRRAAALHS